jgi:hypothetical protein
MEEKAMRWQSAKLETRNLTLSLVFLSAFATGCATGISSADQNAPRNNFKGLEICDQKPAEGAMNVARNATITIVVDDVLDGNSVNEDNIQVLTYNGAKFGGTLLLDHEVVIADATTPGCPQGQPVSRISIAPGSGNKWASNQKHIIFFRDRTSEVDITSPVILGMQAQSGRRLQEQVVTFTVGNESTGSSGRALVVDSMTPGRILNLNGDGSPSDLLTLGIDLYTLDNR